MAALNKSCHCNIWKFWKELHFKKTFVGFNCIVVLTICYQLFLYIIATKLAIDTDIFFRESFPHWRQEFSQMLLIDVASVGLVKAAKSILDDLLWVCALQKYYNQLKSPYVQHTVNWRDFE